MAAIERLAADDPRADTRKLTGSDELRLRVGDWRVRFRRDPGQRQLVICACCPAAAPTTADHPRASSAQRELEGSEPVA
ncbi:MAG: type II toxin-antitoxin system RelE family toxin [Solirubrobacteraceae bacterium]